MLSYASARYASICLSASVPAVPVRLALFSATMPELKPATIAVMPIAITAIAITSSIRPKPASDVIRFRMALGRDHRERRGRDRDADRLRPGKARVAVHCAVDAADAVPPRARLQRQGR